MEINKLIESNHKKLREIGWLLYSCDAQELGLNKNEVDQLVKILSDSDLNRGIDEEIEKAYEEGYEDAIKECGH